MYEHTHVYTDAHMSKCVCAYGSQKPNTGVIPQVFYTSFEVGSLIKLEFTK